MGEKDGHTYWPSTCNRSEEPDRSLFGISGSTLSWFSSYLCKRTHRVSLSVLFSFFNLVSVSFPLLLLLLLLSFS